jgi:hypothetical protein
LQRLFEQGFEPLDAFEQAGDRKVLFLLEVVSASVMPLMPSRFRISLAAAMIACLLRA